MPQTMTDKTPLIGMNLTELQAVAARCGLPRFAAGQMARWLYAKRVSDIDAMNCRFCMTGRQGFHGDLTAAAIINQIMSVDESSRLTNIVFMGMGEPMDNPDAVERAIEIMTAKWGFGWSPKRITVSSVGLKKGLERFLNESDCHLAISMHTPIPSQRRDLMPAEKAFSITEIIDILHRYDFSKQRRLSFEYIVFKGVNDSLIYAKEIVKLLRGIVRRKVLHYSK